MKDATRRRSRQTAVPYLALRCGRASLRAELQVPGILRTMIGPDFGSIRVKPLHVAATALASAIVFAAYYFLLPLLQNLFLPAAPANGWIVRPVHAFRFAATVVFGSLTMPLLSPWLRSRGLAADPAKQPELRRAFPRSLFVFGYLILIVYAVGAVFYLSQYTSITEQEIVVHNLVNPRRYGMGDVASLVEIPEGFRVEARKENGPVLNVHFGDGSEESLSLEREGLTHGDLARIRGMLVARTGKAWERDPRAVLRGQ
jgi:hypothetical protein